MSVPISNVTATWTELTESYNAVRMSVLDYYSSADSKLLSLNYGLSPGVSSSKFWVRKDGKTNIEGDLNFNGDISGKFSIYSIVIKNC